MTRILRMRMLRKRRRKQLEGNWDLREVTSYCELTPYLELKDMIFLYYILWVLYLVDIHSFHRSHIF